MTSSRRFTKDKVVNKAIREYLKQGYTILSGGRHIKIGCPDGKMVVVSRTASTQFALQYLHNDIKRLRESNE